MLFNIPVIDNNNILSPGRSGVLDSDWLIVTLILDFDWPVYIGCVCWVKPS